MCHQDEKRSVSSLDRYDSYHTSMFVAFIERWKFKSLNVAINNILQIATVAKTLPLNANQMF